MTPTKPGLLLRIQGPDISGRHIIYTPPALFQGPTDSKHVPHGYVVGIPGDSGLVQGLHNQYTLGGTHNWHRTELY